VKREEKVRRIREKENSLILSLPMLFGFVFFRQQRDDTNRRGYLQRSVVLITPFGFTSLFKDVVSSVGLMYFDTNESCVEAACHALSAWPRLRSGEEVKLPLLGSVVEWVCPTISRSDTYYFRVLGRGKRNGSTRSRSISSKQVLSQPTTCLMGWFVEQNVYKALFSVLLNAWCLWELVITGRPLMVFGSTPARVSDTVTGLVSLVSPLTYHGDYRPYFSIYDQSLNHFQTLHDAKADVLPSVILGCTNPFLLKTFQNFPNILKLGGDVTPNSPSMTAIPLKKSRVVSSLSAARVDLIEPMDGEVVLAMKDKCAFEPDPAVLKRLLSPADSEDEEQREARIQINGMVIRKHFYQLTQLFLLPFEHYFEYETKESAHLGSNWNPYLVLPSLPRFDEAKFLVSVRNHVDQFPVKGLKINVMQRKKRLMALYQQFLRGPNFIPWFSHQQDIAKVRMKQHMRSRLCQLKGDLFLRLVCHVSLRTARLVRERAQRYYDSIKARPVEDKELLDAIQDHLNTIDSLLPPTSRAPAKPKVRNGAQPCSR